MRILDVNNSYSPSGGGIRTYHDQKIAYFASRGHEIALAAPGAVPGVERRGNASIHWLESLPMLRSGYRICLRGDRVREVIDAFRPDIVEIGSPYVMPGIVREALAGSGVPAVGFFHTDFAECYVRPFLSDLLGHGVGDAAAAGSWKRIETTYTWMQAVLGASRSILARLHAAGLRRLLHTPLGVDTALFSPAKRSETLRRSLGAGAGMRIVLFLARLHPEKGLAGLMESYPLFRDPSRIVLVIGGRGPWERKLNGFLREYPEVRRLPYLAERGEVAEALASADVYLSLGMAETFGLAALEALACGTVTVLPDASGAADMAADYGFAPFVPGSPEALATAVGEALRRIGPDASAKLRSRVLERGGWESCFGRIEGCYRMLIEAAAGGGSGGDPSGGGWWRP